MRAIRIGAYTPGCIAVAALVALAGCGSSKPAYCSTRTNLENSIKALTSAPLRVTKEEFKKIQTDANTLVSQAKSDFPSETSAIKSSMDSLTSTVNALGHPIGTSPTSASQIATLTSSASGVVSSVKSFVEATNSKCS